MESAKASGPYSRSEVRRILGINENRLRSWERTGLAEARSEYTFTDLVSLKTLQRLRESSIPLRRIQQAIHQLRLRLAGIQRPLDELKIVSDGRRIAVELPGERMEALTGQMLFDFEAEPLKPVETLSAQPAPAQPLGGLAGPGEAWFDYALELERTGAPTREVIGVYHKILESNPDAAGAWLNIGTLQYRDGDLVLAERSYERALEIYPEYPLAHFNLGNICEHLNRLDEAADHYRAALRHQSNYADAHYNLALILERSRRLLEAAGHWQAYLNLDPSSPWSNIARRKRRTLLSLAAGGQPSPGASFSKPLREERS